MNLSTKWLPEIPTSWQIANPKTLFSERTQKSMVSDIHLTPSQKFGVLPQSEYMEMTGGSLVLNLTGSDNMKHVEKNDFIIHLRSFQGGIEHSNYSGKVSNAYCVLKPTQQIEPRYFRWVLKSQGYIQELNATTDQLRDGQSIKFEQFASIGLPLPPIEVQRRIADYLDNKLLYIERLIKDKQELANKVDEYFDVAVKNEVLGKSGDVLVNCPPWATHVEADRELIELGRLVKIRGEKNDPIKVDQVLSLTAKRGVILYQDKGAIGNVASEEISRYSIVRKGDLVVNCMNIIIGSVGISNYEGVLSPVYYVLKPIDPNVINMEYLALHFRIREFQRQLIRIGYGILDHRMRIPWVNLKAEKMAIPPIAVQNAVVARISELDKARISIQETIETSISSLQAYKISLISELVTGTMSVPNKKEEVNA